MEKHGEREPNKGREMRDNSSDRKGGQKTKRQSEYEMRIEKMKNWRA